MQKQDKLEEIVERYEEIKRKLQQIDISTNFTEYTELNKTLKEIEDVVELYRLYKMNIQHLQDNKDLLREEKDGSFREMIKDDISGIEQEVLILEKKIEEELSPKDPNDHKNVILEIHAGVGGDEAGIFAGDLFKMYCRYSEARGWKVDIVDYVESTSGGYKDIVCNITGKDVYSFLKYESGVHRVQRIPKTENKGRVHTSAASVVILPEIDNLDIDLNMNDIRKDTFCSTGAGGQSVNTTYSAVRLTHIPTGIVVTCQDERSQIKNYEKALKVLRARIYKMEEGKQTNFIREQKREMVKSGDRADKIRTYNYPQNRITDHRINFTVHNLGKVMADGSLDEIINALKVNYV